MNIDIGNTGGKAVGNLTFDVQAGLLHFGSLEIMRERRDLAWRWAVIVSGGVQKFVCKGQLTRGFGYSGKIRRS